MGLLVLAGVLATLGLAALWVGRHKSRLAAAIRGARATGIASLPDGARVEIAGSCQCAEPLAEPGGGDKCVYYAYRVELEEVSRDHRGRPQAQRWKTVDSGRSSVPFELANDAGSVTIQPEGADFEAPVVCERWLEVGEPLEEGLLKHALGVLSTPSDVRRRIRVEAVSVGTSVHIVGTLQRSPDSEPRIGAGRERLVISTRPEADLLGGLVWQGRGLLALSALLLAGAGFAALLGAPL